MNRRRFILSVGAASLVAGTVHGSGAFSSVEKETQMSVAAVEDEKALLTLEFPSEKDVGTGGVIELIIKNETGTALDTLNVTFDTGEFDGTIEGFNLDQKLSGSTTDSKEITLNDQSEFLAGNEFTIGIEVGGFSATGSSNLKFDFTAKRGSDNLVIETIDEQDKRVISVTGEKESQDILARGSTVIYVDNSNQKKIKAINIADDLGTGDNPGIRNEKTLIEESNKIKALGSPIKFDASTDIKLPYVTKITNDSGNENPAIKTTDSDGNTNILIDDSNPSKFRPRSGKTLMTSGSFDGSVPSVFYVTKSDKHLARVDRSKADIVSTLGGNSANAVMGIGDINNDSNEELIFADGSQQVRYFTSGLKGFGTKVQGGGAGSNNGIGVGKPADFDDNGIVRVPIVAGNDTIRLVGDSESNDDISISQDSTRKSVVTVANVGNNTGLEIVYPSKDGNIKLIDDPLSDSPSVVEINRSPFDKVGIVSGLPNG